MKRSIFTGILMLSLVVSLFAQQNDRQLFRLAEQRLETGDYALSIRSYQQLINDFPGSPYIPDAQARLGIAQFGAGRPDQALIQFNKVESRYRSSAYLSVMPFWLGLSYFELGQYTATIGELTRYLDTFAGVPEDLSSQKLQATLILARSYDRVDDKPQAVQVLESILTPEGLFPPRVIQTFPTIPVELTTWYLQLQSFDVLSTYLEQLPLEGFSQENLRLFAFAQAEVSFNQNDFSSAREYYESLLGRDDAFAGLSYQRLFQIAEINEDPEEQSRIIRLAETDLRGNSDILIPFWLRVGQASYYTDQPQVAELYLLKIWDIRGERDIPDETVLFLSQIEEDRDNSDRALSMLREYLAMVPDADPRVRIKAADIALRNGNLEDVLTLLRPITNLSIEQANEQSSRISAASFGQAVYLQVTAQFQQGLFDDAFRTITSALSHNREGGFTAELLEYRGRIELQRGNLDAAQASFRQHLVHRPNNFSIASAYIRTLIQLTNYTNALTEGQRLLTNESDPDRALEQYNRGYIELLYQTGLASLHLGKMHEAEILLARLPGLPGPDWYRTLYPSILYYRGWAAYQQQRDRIAVRFFQEMLEVDTNHPKAQEAAYLSGWASFRLGDFPAASGFFQGASLWEPDRGFAQASQFLLAKTLRASRTMNQALIILEDIWNETRDNPFRDDAQYERGQLLVELGRFQEASVVFEDLQRTLPQSEFAPLSLYRKGLALLSGKNFAEARQALQDFRDNYPNHPLLDAVLFAMGEASIELGETGAATLYWQRLANDHRQSSYRFEALRRTAEIFESQGDQSRALNLYSELVARYPNESSAQRIQEKVDQLGLILTGIDQQEATLRVRIEQNQGVATTVGREAILELGQLIIIDRPAANAAPGNLIPALTELAALAERFADQASRAAFLLGEWYSVSGNHDLAAVFFLQAAETGGNDVAPLYYYRTIEVLRSRNRISDATSVLSTMVQRFPRHELTQRATNLMNPRGAN